jgi:hypothetical protein
MTLDELSATLPNGFHDSELLSLNIDYIAHEVSLALRVWVGNLSSSDPKERESYRPGILRLSGMLYFSIEPPDSRYKSEDHKAPSFDTGAVSSLTTPPRVELPCQTEEAFTNWIFVNQWNAFMYVSAREAALSWDTS